MPDSHLRVFWPDDHRPSRHSATTVETVKVPLAEVLPLFTDAVRNRRAWLTDFENEEITISADLYEVLHAYEHYRPTA
ncbi:MAG: hypothetical protein R3C99_07550 [Pirellulaceae bacterium]|nr:hypothetical protein [Planctomycetales bacterium]MCA9206778.1 hypothetical protein [Planctomycetales bacterium]MCA9221390.1 hypothetical protein [Planctomycetales bacterium]MCA9224735.1 hypothetical protein [Planctomycetales bacterium]